MLLLGWRGECRLRVALEGSLRDHLRLAVGCAQEELCIGLHS
jgi:hypothetical protein